MKVLELDIWKDYQLELKLVGSKGMTDEEFFDFCQTNRDYRIERDANGNIILMAPTGFLTGHRNSNIIIDLGMWNRQQGLGKVGDSSTGYKFPDGVVRSPDASWISNEKLARFSDAELEKFIETSPEFVVELRSFHDNLKKLKRKMEVYIQNGCQLGWLLDKKNEHVYIYRSDGTVEQIESFNHILLGEHVLPGFEFDLKWLK